MVQIVSGTHRRWILSFAITPIMKIMHVIDSAGIYGAEVMLLNLMEEHSKMGLDPLLFSIEPSDNTSGNSLSEEAHKRGLNAVKYPSDRRYSLATALHIMRFAEDHGVSLLHSHGYKGNILLGSIPRFMRKIPVMSTVHGWTSIRSFTKIWFYTLLDKFFLRRMNAIVNVNSKTMMNTGRAERFIVENGISPLKFDSDFVTRADPAISAFCKEDFIVGSISRLSDEKGIVYLIKAVRSLTARGIHVKAVVVGDGPQKEMLQELVFNNNLSDRILLTGYRNNAFNYLPFFNVFVLPSLTEGLPITILEAMQAGVPIVATKVGGIPDLLGCGRFGIMVEPRDAEAIAEAVNLLFSDTALSQRMAKAAREEVLSKYSSRRMAEKYLEIYDTVLSKWKQ